MASIAEAATAVAMSSVAMPRFEDGTADLQEPVRRVAEDVADQIMDAEADQLCGATGNARNGYRPRKLLTCMGELTLRIPKLRRGSFFPDDLMRRYGRADGALLVPVAETCATGTSTRKVGGIMEELGISHLSKDQVSSMVRTIDADVEELMSRSVGGLRTPYVWLDATYVKCRRDGRVASTAVVTAIGCDEDGWRRVLGLSVVDTESYDSWLGFLRKVRGRGIHGVTLVVSDAHEGLRRAISEVFQGAAWQRCVTHLMRDCMRAAGSKRERTRVARIVAPVFRPDGPGAVRAMYHAACDMLSDACPKAAAVLEDAEPDALAYLDFPRSHWLKTRTNNWSGPTGRSSGATGSCRPSRRRPPWSDWWGPSSARSTTHGRGEGTSRASGCASSMMPRGRLPNRPARKGCASWSSWRGRR